MKFVPFSLLAYQSLRGSETSGTDGSKSEADDGEEKVERELHVEVGVGVWRCIGRERVVVVVVGERDEVDLIRRVGLKQLQW